MLRDNFSLYSLTETPSSLTIDPCFTFLLGPQSLYSHLVEVEFSSNGLSSSNPYAVVLSSPRIVDSLEKLEIIFTSITTFLSSPLSSSNFSTFFCGAEVLDVLPELFETGTSALVLNFLITE